MASRITLKCRKCGNKFRRVMNKPMSEMRCPRCGSYSIGFNSSK